MHDAIQYQYRRRQKQEVTLNDTLAAGPAEYPLDSKAGPLSVRDINGGPPLDLGAAPTRNPGPALGGPEP